MRGLLCGELEKLQLAPESRWEECVAFSRGEAPDGVLLWLDAFHDKNIGVEAFFTARCEYGKVPSFIGLRCGFAQCRAFAQEAVCAFSRGAMAYAEDFAAAAGERFGAELFHGEPDFMELGLVNMWKSFGEIAFSPMPRDPFGALASALAASPRWNVPLPAPPALELAYSSPLPHWLGLSLSSCGCGAYSVDMKKAEALLKGLG